MGPSIIMPNEILQHIIDCAHHKKINTMEDLTKETRWSCAEEFGTEVLAIIQAHVPVPTPAVLSLVHLPNFQPSSNTITPKAKRACSRCNSSEHIGIFLFFSLDLGSHIFQCLILAVQQGRLAGEKMKMCLCPPLRFRTVLLSPNRRCQIPHPDFFIPRSL
jgi:hypothetical protein